MFGAVLPFHPQLKAAAPSELSVPTPVPPLGKWRAVVAALAGAIHGGTRVSPYLFVSTGDPVGFREKTKGLVIECFLSAPLYNSTKSTWSGPCPCCSLRVRRVELGDGCWRVPATSECDPGPESQACISAAPAEYPYGEVFTHDP